MGKKISLKKIICLSSFILVIIFASCSQNLPEIGQANTSVIFEYEDTESLPKARFSVFVDSVSNPRRFASLRVRSEEENYEWEIDDLIMFETSEKTFAGYTNFVMPEGLEIPKGKYSVIFTNADEEEIEKEFYIDYNSDFYELKSTEIPDYMKKRSANNKIAIYDNDSLLIYYGERNKDFKTTRDIWNKYQNAEFFNDIWSMSGNTVICILPQELVKPEKVEAEEPETESEETEQELDEKTKLEEQTRVVAEITNTVKNLFKD